MGNREQWEQVMGDDSTSSSSVNNAELHKGNKFNQLAPTNKSPFSCKDSGICTVKTTLLSQSRSITESQKTEQKICYS